MCESRLSCNLGCKPLLNSHLTEKLILNGTKKNSPIITGRAVDSGVVRRSAATCYASASSVSISGFKPARAVIAQLSISGSSLAK